MPALGSCRRGTTRARLSRRHRRDVHVGVV